MSANKYEGAPGATQFSINPPRHPHPATPIKTRTTVTMDSIPMGIPIPERSPERSVYPSALSDADPPTLSSAPATESGTELQDVKYEAGAWTSIPGARSEEKRGRTWAKAAGRTKGTDGYKDGDCTRSLIGCLRGKKDRGWKEAAGRTSGSDGYKFGDLSRVAVSNLFGDKHKDKGAGGAGMGTMPKPNPLFSSTAQLFDANTSRSLLDGVWLGFFNSSYAVGRLALGAGELTVDAIEDSEPSVLIGLPALALMECAIRSALSAKDGQLVTFSGKKVARTTLLRGAAIDHVRGVQDQAAAALSLFDTMLELAKKVGDCRLSAAGLATLRARALAVSGTDVRVGGLEPAEDAEVNGLVALSQSVATRVSQLPMYKHAFNMVLQALSDEKRHEMDMMKMMGGWEK